MIFSINAKSNVLLPVVKETFDMSEKDLPAFDEGWAETFLNGLFYTYRSSFDKMEKEIKELSYEELKKSGVTEIDKDLLEDLFLKNIDKSVKMAEQ